MKKLIAIAVLALSLGGCANFQNAWGIVSGATVSPVAVYVARNSFDAAEVSATNYIVFCKVHPATYGCSKVAIARLIPAVRSGRVARNNLISVPEKQSWSVGASRTLQRPECRDQYDPGNRVTV